MFRIKQVFRIHDWQRQSDVLGFGFNRFGENYRCIRPSKPQAKGGSKFKEMERFHWL